MFTKGVIVVDIDRFVLSLRDKQLEQLVSIVGAHLMLPQCKWLRDPKKNTRPVRLSISAVKEYKHRANIK